MYTATNQYKVILEVQPQISRRSEALSEDLRLGSKRRSNPVRLVLLISSSKLEP